MARTKKIVHIRQPSARIGGKVGANISSRGVSTSARTLIGTFNSKRGFTLGGRRRMTGCGMPVLLIAVLALILATWWHHDGRR